MIDKQEIYHAISKYESIVETCASRVSTTSFSLDDFYKHKERKLSHLADIMAELEEQALKAGLDDSCIIEPEVMKQIVWFYENSVEFSKTLGGKIHKSQVEKQKEYWIDSIKDYMIMLFDFVDSKKEADDTADYAALKHGVWISPKEFSIETWGADIARLVIAFRGENNPQDDTNFVCGAYRDDLDMFFSYCGSVGIIFRDGKKTFIRDTIETYPIEITGYMVLPFVRRQND